MTTPRTVCLYVDFISPYAWLALMASREFARRHAVSWELRPVVYGVLLDRSGLVGPAEVPAKRRYTFLDVAREAERAGLALVGPPAHPFRSLDALRVATLFRESTRAVELARELADAAWGAGRDLTDPAVLRDVVAGVGLDAADLEARIADPAIKDALRETTDDAIERGVFGVPTFLLDDEPFWGHDRMDALARRLGGEARIADRRVRAILDRPRGVDRRRSPLAAGPGDDGKQ